MKRECKLNYKFDGVCIFFSSESETCGRDTTAFRAIPSFLQIQESLIPGNNSPVTYSIHRGTTKIFVFSANKFFFPSGKLFFFQLVYLYMHTQTLNKFLVCTLILHINSDKYIELIAFR